jgi:hypothetical protein
MRLLGRSVAWRKKSDMFRDGVAENDSISLTGRPRQELGRHRPVREWRIFAPCPRSNLPNNTTPITIIVR